MKTIRYNGKTVLLTDDVGQVVAQMAMAKGMLDTLVLVFWDGLDWVSRLQIIQTLLRIAVRLFHFIVDEQPQAVPQATPQAQPVCGEGVDAIVNADPNGYGPARRHEPAVAAEAAN